MTIDVRSRGGAGTTFSVKLPPARQTPAPPRRSPPGRALRVLVVDDEPFLRRVTRRLLRPHEVVEAASADEGLSILSRDPAFDAILCDLMMPGRSGTDFYNDLTARAPQLAGRFIFVSGGAVSEEAEAFLSGFPPERVVLKPFTAHQLHTAVAQVGAGDAPR